MQWRMLTCPLPTIAVGDDRQSEYDHAVTNTDLPSFYNRCPGEWWCQSEHDNAARMCEWEQMHNAHVHMHFLHTFFLHMHTVHMHMRRCIGQASGKRCSNQFRPRGPIRSNRSKAFLAIGFALARNRRQCAVFGSTKRNSQLPNLIHIVFCVFFCFL